MIWICKLFGTFCVEFPIFDYVFILQWYEVVGYFIFLHIQYGIKQQFIFICFFSLYSVYEPFVYISQAAFSLYARCKVNEMNVWQIFTQTGLASGPMSHEFLILNLDGPMWWDSNCYNNQTCWPIGFYHILYSIFYIHQWRL